MTDTDNTAIEHKESSDRTEQYDSSDGLLVLDGVVKRFGGLTAVDDLSFTVQEGEILGFIGPNGAGKTTTFNCVMGTYEPDEGTIYYDNEEITGKPTQEIVKHGLTRTFQTARPIEEFTVAQNIGFPLLSNKFFSVSRKETEIWEKVTTICSMVGMDFEDLEKYPDELPHAGLLRVELARALIQDPRVVLVDEVFAGLSAGEVASFVDTLEELRAEGHTFVVIDHNMRGLLELIDRAIVINFGAKIAEGTPEEIRENPEVQKAYLGSETL